MKENFSNNTNPFMIRVLCATCGTEFDKKRHKVLACKDHFCSKACFQKDWQSTSPDVANAVRLYTELGIGVKQIVKRTGIPRTTLQRVLAKLKVPRLKGFPHGDPKFRYKKWQHGANPESLILADYKHEYSALKQFDESRHWLNHPIAGRLSWATKAAKRHASDPVFRMKCRMRTTIHNAIRKNSNRIRKRIKKADRTQKLIGCSPRFLIGWLESHFTRGMSWGNYGWWHVDHRIPCASFDLTDPKQQRICFHYSNLQPMWGRANIQKSNKFNRHEQIGLLLTHAA